jgi:hypothetical protein
MLARYLREVTAFPMVAGSRIGLALGGLFLLDQPCRWSHHQRLPRFFLGAADPWRIGMYVISLAHTRFGAAGYTRADAGKRLSANHGMIASFSRALAEDLRHSMSDAAFNATLTKSHRRDEAV